MLCNKLEQTPDGWRADVAIVGAGAVGLLLAVDLAKAGKRVLLLEAGQAVAGAADYVLDEVSSQGRRFDGLGKGRFRALGGTTTQWGGQLVPLEPLAFEARGWAGEVAWPIDVGDIAPEYERVLDYLGMQRRLDDRAVWERLRVDLPKTGRDLSLFLTRWAPEPNFARLFAGELRGNPNLVVVTGAQVTGLFAADDFGRVGLVVRDQASARRLMADQIVLANGTIEIARLLLLPLEQGRAAPWADNAWLGRGFADHVDAYAGTVQPIDARRFHAVFDAAVLDGLKYLPKLRLSDEVQRRERLLGIAAHFVSSSARTEELVAIKTMARNVFNRTALAHDPINWRHVLRLGDTMARTAGRYLLYRRIYNPGDAGIRLRVTSEQMMVRESGLALTAERDGHGVPKAVLDWRVDGGELRTLARFAKAVQAYLKAHDLADVVLDPRLVAEDPGFLDAVEDGYHHMGMARMGATRADGVVDRDLKVFGTDNLFVAGAAVFRSSGFANPTLTALALALRLSRQIQSGGR